MMIDSDEYLHNTGAFASNDPFQRRSDDASDSHSLPRSISSSLALSSSYYSLSAFFSRLRFYYRSLLSHLPIPAALKGDSHAYASLSLDSLTASTSSTLPRSSSSLHPLTASVQDQLLTPQEADMQALLKKV